ncbi:MAG: hypothetical protein ACJA2B_001043 [Candidatus Endobugula sp.]|jgi:hypothetical protein
MSDYISPKSVTSGNNPLSTQQTGKVSHASQQSIPQQSIPQQAISQQTISQANLARTESTSAATRTATEMVDTLVKQLTQQKTMNANVSSSKLLDSKAQQLLAKINPNVAAQVKSPPSSAQAAPALYLVKLASTIASTVFTPTNTTLNNPTLNNTTTNNPSLNMPTLLTTVTTTPFKAGDQVELLLNKQGQIVVKPSVSGVRPAIAENFKQALPQQQSLSLLLNTANSIGKLPLAIQSALLAKSTQLPLNQLEQFSYKPTQLQSPLHVKTALQQSGILTESKLQQQQPIGNDLRTALGQLTQTLQQETSLQGTQKNDHLFSKTAFDQIINLLVQQLPQQAVAAKTSGNTITQQLASLMQLLGVKITPNGQADSKKIREVAAKQLEQMAKGIQDKIHLNQLRSLGADGKINDDNTLNYSSGKTQPFVTEISLRWGEHVLPLHISITEEESKKNDGSNHHEKEEKKTTRRWQVFMSFDLPADLHANSSSFDPKQQSKNTPPMPIIETLHSKLTIIDDTVSATLWSESLTLCQKAKQQFTFLRNTLTAHGLQVEELHCINGKPPSQDVSLDYNLIDIKT